MSPARAPAVKLSGNTTLIKTTPLDSSWTLLPSVSSALRLEAIATRVEAIASRVEAIVLLRLAPGMGAMAGW